MIFLLTCALPFKNGLRCNALAATFKASFFQRLPNDRADINSKGTMFC